MSSMNFTASLKRGAVADLEWNKYQEQIDRVRGRFKNFLNHSIQEGDVPQRLVFPIVSPPDQIGHFFVACFDFSVNHPHFFVDVCFYDSLERSQKRIHRSSTAATYVKKVNTFFKNFILHEDKYQHLHRTDAQLLHRVQYKDCPPQANGYDCGIFAVAVVLHLLERKPVDTTTFSQSNVTEARKELGKALTRGPKSKQRRIEASKVFRNCFHFLAQRVISEGMIINIPTDDNLGMTTTATASTTMAAAVPASTMTEKERETAMATTATVATTTTAMASMPSSVTVPPEMERASTMTGSPTMAAAVTAPTMTEQEERETAMANTATTEATVMATATTATTTQASTPSSVASATPASIPTNDDSVSALSGDTIFYDVMNEAKLECFPTLEAVNPIVEAYEARTGNYLRIKRSINKQFRVYECREHLECPFQIRISRRRVDGSYVVSKMKTHHSDVRRDPKAKDGRQWKKRRHSKLNEVLLQVLKTKDGDPTPADIIKTAANQSGLIVPYMAAYRAITNDAGAGRRLTVRSFQQMVPYLEEMNKCNPMSLIGCTKKITGELEDVYFFPGFMNDALTFVRPVVSLDAAHLRSEWLGTLYIASVLSGNNDVFPIGLMISDGNEDGETWTKMLTLLKRACPIIHEQGHRTGIFEHPFLFVSDRDKGLLLDLKEVFPRNFDISCAKHIQKNVCTQFGKPLLQPVMAIAKTYSARRACNILDRIRQDKPRAAAYIENLENTGVLWKCSQWVDAGRYLPPRYGIITSNTSECVNNMFNKARDVAWMEALETIVDIMSTRICKLRTKYSRHDDSEVVPRFAQILRARWDAAAGMDVEEIELDSRMFKVFSAEYRGDDEEGSVNDAASPMERRGVHIVKLTNDDLPWCSCGVWQDCLYPCRHGCAVYRKWNEVDINYVVTNLVDAKYKFGNVKNTFARNIFPVSLDAIQYDGITKPPVVNKRQPGRPKEKRIRNRSEYLAPEDSPVVCGNCGRRGHNRRTCRFPAREVLNINADGNGDDNNGDGDGNADNDDDRGDHGNGRDNEAIIIAD